MAPPLYQQALQLLNTDLSAAEKLARRFARQAPHDEPAQQGLAQRLLGHVSLLRSRHRQARQHYERAIAAFQAAGETLEVAITQSGAAAALIYLADFARLEEWASAARAVFAARGDRARLARLDGNLALGLFRQDRFREAYAIYDRLHAEFLAVGRPVDVANILWNKCTCLISLGDYRLAATVYQEARNFAVEQQMPVQAAAVDYNVAYLHYLCGDYTEAMQLYAVARQTGEPYRRALCDLDEAEMFLELNLHHEAGQYAQRAGAQFHRLRMPYEQGKAVAFLAIAAGQLGRRETALKAMASARRIFRREQNRVWLALLDLYEAILLERFQQPELALRRALRAQAFFATSEFPGKAFLCDIFLARLRFAAGELHLAHAAALDLNQRLATYPSPSIRFQALHLEAEILETLGRLGEARRRFRQAHEILEELRFRLRGEEIKIAFLKDKLSIYESLFLLHLHAPADAFEFVEKAKSRALLEALNTLPDAENETLIALRRELDITYQQLQRLEASPQPQSFAALRAEAHRLEANLAGRVLAQRSAGLASGSGRLTSLDELAAVLPPRTSFVEYFVARGDLFALVLSAGARTITPLGNLREVERCSRFLRLQLQFAEGDPRAIQTHLQGLYQMLVNPVRHLLTGDSLVVIPHGVLHSIPFAALLDNEEPLLRRYVLSQAPSASLYREALLRPPAAAGAPLVLGVADALAPEMEVEAAQVAASLDGAQLFTGSQATTEVFRQLAPTAPLIHVAAHGHFQSQNPMFSSLQLADSRLTAFDLHRLRFVADLVVLSGCGTGLNQITAADELLGIARGLLAGGARAAVLSHWDVRDECAARFMGNFYQLLQVNRNSPAEALRRASLDLRSTYESVRDWAAFYLVGAGEKV